MKVFNLFFAALFVTFVFIKCTGDQQSSSTTTSDTTKTTTAKPYVPKVHKPAPQLTYTLDSSKKFLKSDSLTENQWNILTAINRTDRDNIKSLKSILVPSDMNGDVENYLPFPATVPGLKNVSKLLLFSYPAQVFAAYEYGDLVYTGPTNMGRKKDPTPTGLYFTNWKAEQTTSTFNDEWDLKWNFNIENKEGIGFHQYALPGYPASHSCLRLKEADAKFLYTFADQWEVKGTDDIKAKGTPVIVFGTYDFDGKKPWLQLVTDPAVLNISADDVSATVAPYMQKITDAQQQRDTYLASSSK